MLTITILLFSFFSSFSYSQQLSDVSPSLLISKMENTYLKVKREGNLPEVFVDLIAKKYVQKTYPENAYSEKEGHKVDFDYLVYEGSFKNPGEKEYLLQITLARESYVPFFSHAENNGNTTMIILFNQDYNQISDVSFHYQCDSIIDLVDINEDGILEVITKGYYAIMGCNKNWINIYSINMDNSLLEVTVDLDCENEMVEGNRISLSSNYTIQNGGILFKSTLKYYTCKFKSKRKGETINKFYKTEHKKDFYKFENNIFTHIENNNNVNWDDPRLNF